MRLLFSAMMGLMLVSTLACTRKSSEPAAPEEVPSPIEELQVEEAPPPPEAAPAPAPEPEAVPEPEEAPDAAEDL